MMIIKFRREEDAHHLLKKVKKMREEIEDVEELLEDCMEDEDTSYRDERYDDIDDDRRLRRNERMSSRRYRRDRI